MVAMHVPIRIVDDYTPTTTAEPTRPIAADPRSIELIDEAQRMARSPANLLILGPSGAGKDVYARYVHDCSPRSDGPFVAMSAAAIPENLMEAELFGHAEGAFSGSRGARAGLLETADKGTLFLDEIGDMPPETQTRLLEICIFK